MYEKIINGNRMLGRIKSLYRKGAVGLDYFNIVREALQMEEPIEAIPVDWLIKVRNSDKTTIDDVELIDWIIECWRDEQKVKEND